MGLLSDIFIIYVMIIIFVLLGLIWYARYSYTRNSRDKTYWNRMVFAEDGKKPSTLSPTVLNSVANSIASECAKPSGSNCPAPSGGMNKPPASSNNSPASSNAPPSSTKTNYNILKRGGDSWDDDSTWNNIDYNMFAGQKFGFNTNPVEPTSAGARDASGNLYGDTSTYLKDGRILKVADGRLGIWDTSGDFLDFDDVSSVSLNTQQGYDFNSINSGKISPVSLIGNSVDFCKKNPSAYDPKTALPCKQVWCMANPTESWKDPVTSKFTPCKTLFSYL